METVFNLILSNLVWTLVFIIHPGPGEPKRATNTAVQLFCYNQNSKHRYLRIIFRQSLGHISSKVIILILHLKMGISTFYYDIT